MASTALGQMGPAAQRAVPALNTVQATDADADVRAAAASALEAIDPSLRVLVDGLTAPDPNRRLWAVSVLAVKGPEARAAVPELIAVLKQDDVARVRAGAALALGKMGAEARSACPGLIEALKDPAAPVRATAALALGLIGPEAHGAGPALAAALTDEDAEVAASAATALGNLGPEAEAAVPLLIDLAEAGRPRPAPPGRQRPGADRPGGPGGGPGPPGGPQGRRPRAPPRRRAGPGLRRPAGRRSPSRTDRGPALHRDRCRPQRPRLGLPEPGPDRAHRPAEAVPPLVTALQDDDANVRAAASLALGRIGPPAVRVPRQGTRPRGPRVRAGAAHALGSGRTGARRALAALREALRDEDPGVVPGRRRRPWAGSPPGSSSRRIPGASPTWKTPSRPWKLRRQAHRPRTGGRVDGRVVQVREAIRALRTVQRARFFDRIFHSPWFPWLAGALLYVVVVLSLWLLLLWLRPLVLLRVNDILRRLPHA